ncbi:diguanylate cyclase (GGDEF) domain-containing protein [Lachnospiraceae bacterium KH1T2]|nr:diguanylate cyclase (GGDEF) domain-containing protein [Lachnospiraceae bacterium KH1T2]
MIINNYPEKIQNLIKLCNEERFSSPRSVIDYAEELHLYADSICDSALAGYADFSIGDAYFTQCDSENCMRYINAAMKELFAAADWQLLGECYNLFGILCEHQGNISGAIESYSQANILIERYSLYVLGAMVHANYSTLLHKGGDDLSALEEILICNKYIKHIQNDDHYAYLPIQIQINTIRIYISLMQKKRAAEELAKLEEMFAARPEQSYEVDYYLMRLMYSDLCKDEMEEKRCLDNMMQALHECEYKVDYLDDCTELMTYLKRKNRYDLIRVVLKELEGVTSSNDFADTLMTFSGFRCDLLQHEGRWSDLLDELRHYRRLSDTHKKSLYNVMKIMMETHQSLLETEKANFALQKRLGTDELTKLANRKRLNEESDKLFESAKKNELFLGVEMLDIDNFKQINDTYGHQTGDNCLQALADAMRSIENPKVFCARYGGDEFQILFTNCSDDEISVTTTDLRNKLSEILSALSLPPITISQGICNNIPTDSNRLWDFTSIADRALYEAKKLGRDTTVLIHEPDDLVY